MRYKLLCTEISAIYITSIIHPNRNEFRELKRKVIVKDEIYSSYKRGISILSGKVHSGDLGQEL
jgi:hypothetical protein